MACLAVLLLASVSPGRAQLPGVTPSLPPGVDRRFELVFGNDFLGRGGKFDDFRTQQIGLVGSFSRRWNLVVDHSILTLEEDTLGGPGRIDHLSVSASYSLVEVRTRTHTQGVEVGGGFRYSGDVGGARMQNGFHQIVGSKLATMPYVDTDRVDGLLWLRLPRTGVLKRGARLPLLGGGWDFGYWGRAATLVTTDAEWDGTLGLSAVASRRWFQGWLGVQGDWRAGHDRDEVSRATADFEQGAGVVIGLRFGPLLIESVQQFTGDAAYGHFSLVSTGRHPITLGSEEHAVAFGVGLTIPDVLASFQARWSDCELLRCSASWRRTILFDFRSGRPQFGSHVDEYVATRQWSTAFELERAPAPGHEWLTAFGALGAGWRTERLEGAGEALGGVRSEAVGRPGLVGDLGLRFGMSGAGRSLNLMAQIGLSGWIPTSTGTVAFAGQTERLQRPVLVVFSGLVLRFATGGS